MTALGDGGRGNCQAVWSYVAATLCALPIAGILARYPLPVSPLAALVAAYAACLWRWPNLFLVVIPIVLPALDLGFWTGWYMIGEADLFVLATIGILSVRAPPAKADLFPPGWPGRVLAFLCIATTIALVVGLASPLGYTGLSGNPYLRPDHALRLAKGLAEALLLLPFLRQRHRTQGDAAAWFGGGIVAGLVAVTLLVLAERALFAGILDLGTDYRVAGPFSSMHVGGGHIGAYTALALPFAFALGLSSMRWLPLAGLGGVGGAYTLIVTFARTGYTAGLVGCGVMGLALSRAFWRRGGWARVAMVVPFVLLAAAVAGAASSGVMRERLMAATGDMLTRESNWRAGWAVRDPGILTDVFGMGLGTYQRTMLSRGTVNRPSDFGLSEDGNGRFVWVRVESPFFLGQKIVLPATGSMHLKLRFRGAIQGAGLGWSVCDKVLLYSDNCQTGRAAAAVPGAWQEVSATIPVAGLGAGIADDLIRRPVELAFFGFPNGASIAMRDIGLTDDAGRPLLTNGDFRRGMDRWLFTDDSHVSWRILNEYLMLLFETGVAGLTAYLAVAGLAIMGGIRSALRGDPIGAAVAGSVTSFLLSGLFDNVLEAPRIATLFYLVCFGGMLLWDAPAAIKPSPQPSTPTA